MDQAPEHWSLRIRFGTGIIEKYVIDDVGKNQDYLLIGVNRREDEGLTVGALEV
jgi:hypothetical protein